MNEPSVISGTSARVAREIWDPAFLNAAIVPHLRQGANDWDIESPGQALYIRYILHDACMSTNLAELTSHAQQVFSKDYPLNARTIEDEKVFASLLAQIKKYQNLPPSLRSLVTRGLVKPEIVGKGRLAAVRMDSHVPLQAAKKHRRMFSQKYGIISALSWYLSWHRYAIYGKSFSIGYEPRLLGVRFHDQTTFPKMLLLLMEDHVAIPDFIKVGTLAFAELFNGDARRDYLAACQDTLDALVPCFLDKIGRHKDILAIIAKSKSPSQVFQTIALAFGVRAVVALSLQPCANVFDAVQTEAERDLRKGAEGNPDRILIAEMALVAKFIWAS